MATFRRELVVLACLFGSLALTPCEAWAHPPGQARLPVDWTGSPCLTIIDRSQDPLHELDYGLLGEDTPATEDEPPDSHTHQFLGFCRDHDLLTPLPNWIAQSDLDVAVDYGLGNPDSVDPAVDILATHPAWSDCWTEITTAEQRRPITAEAAMEPVLWDTSELSPGTWVVEGYTYEPWANLWSPHPGVFKVVDDPDPAASPPAAALTFAGATKFVGAPLAFSGCVDAMEGSLMTLSWAPVISDPEDPDYTTSSEQLEWVAIDSELPVENGEFIIDWTVPMEAGGTSMLIKLDVEDPMGRTWTAHGLADIGVISISGGDDETGTGESGEDTGADESETGEGCDCRSSAPARGGIWLVPMLLVLGASSRRRASHQR